MKNSTTKRRTFINVKQVVLKDGKVGLNIVVEGNLTNDPPAISEVKGGFKLLKSDLKNKDEKPFSLAINADLEYAIAKAKYEKDKKYDKEATNFLLVEAWRDVAERLKTLTFKGQHIFLSGLLTVNPSKDGQRNFYTLTVEDFKCLTFKDNKNGEESTEKEDSVNAEDNLNETGQPESFEDITQENNLDEEGNQNPPKNYDDIPF